MNINDQARFNQFYQAYLNELTLQGKSSKSVARIATANCTLFGLSALEVPYKYRRRRSP